MTRASENFRGAQQALFLFLVLLVVANTAIGQTTTFTYQGKLNNGGTPANGLHEFEFVLFDALTNGTQVGPTQTRADVIVTNGVFTVQLDFGAAAFNGAPRFLQISVRESAGPALTLLTPRQPVTTAPYSIRSLNSASAETAVNATQLGGITADQYVITSDSRLSDPRSPTPGSSNYIQNSTSLQAASDFNISGNGVAGGTLSANAVNASTQYNMFGQRFLRAAGSASTIAGIGAGAAITTGDSNTFFGRSAGASNTTGGSNAFFGERAGALNSTAPGNSFFGGAAGVSNSTGSVNSFFGFSAGLSNTTGSSNSFFGGQAGFSNTTGVNNSFFGRSAGQTSASSNSNSFFGFEAGRNNEADANSFFGSHAGKENTDGLFNSFFGYNAGFSNIDTDHNSFFGYDSGAANTGNQNAFFGSLSGHVNTTGAGNAFFGAEAGESNTTGGRNSFLGRWAGKSNNMGADNTFVGFNSGLNNTGGSGNVFVGLFAGGFNGNGSNLTIIGANSDVASGSSLVYATAIGADSVVSTSNTVQLGRTNGFDTVRVSGLLVVNGLGVAGSTDVCRNASNQLSTCSSSLRYKDNVRPLIGGLDIVSRLHPITFNWKDGGMHDVGFGAEEVEKVEPLLVTHSNGQIEGVKYGQVTTVLVNAVQQQQHIIEQQQRQIDALKKLVCMTHSDAQVCK